MKLKNVLFAAVATLTVACAADQTDDNNQDASVLVDVSPEEIAARNALVGQTPQTALIKVPLSADGEPDFANAEVRTSMTAVDISSEEKLLSAFENAPVAESVTVNTSDSLDDDTSSNSWALLPWRYRIENGLPVRDGPYLLPWRRVIARQHNASIYGCGYTTCAPRPTCVNRCNPCAPRCATTTTVVTTTTSSCCGGGYAPQAVPYYNHGGYQWDYQATQGFVSGNNYYYGATNAYGAYASSMNWL